MQGERIQELNRKLTKVLRAQEKEKNKKKFWESLRESEKKKGLWYRKDVEKLDLDEAIHLKYALENLKAKVVSEISHRYQMRFNHNYLGEKTSNITQGLMSDGNNEVGIDAFEERRMMDLSVFTNNPIYRSSIGSCANGVITPINKIDQNNQN